jgi:hypothetical protein
MTIKDKSLNIPCSCGHAILRFSKWEEDEINTYIIELFSSTFYDKQQPIWDNIKERLKLIWCGITGKQYQFYDLYIDEDQVDEFVEFVNKPLE